MTEDMQKPFEAPRKEAEAAKKEVKAPKKELKSEVKLVEGIKVFGVYEPSVDVRDPGLRNYISVSPRLVFHTRGRHVGLKRKSEVSIIERLMNCLMRSGSGGKFKGKVYRGKLGCGQKARTYNMVRDAFAIIAQRTKKNPIEILVRAIENSAPREETTRVKFGGITYHIAVDVSPQRRVDFALHNISLATLIGSSNNPKPSTQALSEELINASNNDPKSLAIAKKDEIERVARSAR
jgi:small subunit ribosomal protein S7